MKKAYLVENGLGEVVLVEKSEKSDSETRTYLGRIGKYLRKVIDIPKEKYD